MSDEMQARSEAHFLAMQKGMGNNINNMNKTGITRTRRVTSAPQQPSHKIGLKTKHGSLSSKALMQPKPSISLPGGKQSKGKSKIGETQRSMGATM
jgi:hypothetical protein